MPTSFVLRVKRETHLRYQGQGGQGTLLGTSRYSGSRLVGEQDKRDRMPFKRLPLYYNLFPLVFMLLLLLLLLLLYISIRTHPCVEEYGLVNAVRCGAHLQRERLQGCEGGQETRGG